jgi:hypothetical protein
MHALSQGYFEWRFTRRNLASLLNNLGPISDGGSLKYVTEYMKRRTKREYNDAHQESS